VGAAKRQTLGSELPEGDLFSAVVHVVQQGGYDIGGLSNERRELVFTSGKTLMSWGHMFAAVVESDGTGSVLQLAVAGIPGAPQALLDGRKNKKAATQFIADVEAALAEATPPQPEPVTSFATMPDGSTVPWTSGEWPGG
jgi:hypothetical protein